MVDHYNKNEDIQTVVRGPYNQRDRWMELKDEVQYGTVESFDDFKNYILSKSGCCESYSGVRHKNIFRVNKPILLFGFGFFGPYYEQKAKYTVTIDIENSKGKSIHRHRDRAWVKGDVFKVMLRKPVAIPPLVYYTVQFQLDGPDTAFCPVEKLKTEIGDFSGKDVAFQFQLGSKQMPILYYSPLK